MRRIEVTLLSIREPYQRPLIALSQRFRSCTGTSVLSVCPGSYSVVGSMRIKLQSPKAIESSASRSCGNWGPLGTEAVDDFSPTYGKAQWMHCTIKGLRKTRSTGMMVRGTIPLANIRVAKSNPTALASVEGPTPSSSTCNDPLHGHTTGGATTGLLYIEQVVTTVAYR